MLYLRNMLATICLLTLILYYFLSICRIINKEKWIVDIVNRVYKIKTVDEDITFGLMRPTILQISAITFLLSGGVLLNFFAFKILLYMTFPLAIITNVVHMNRKKK